jgi:fluoride exporter
MDKLLYIGFGGFLGANARYLISGWLVGWLSVHFGWQNPIGTVFVNVTGSFLLAVFIVSSSQRVPMSENMRLLIATGFFGAYTTFSTFANESIAMIQAGNWFNGMSHILGTNALCLLGALLGIIISTRMLSTA